MSFFQDVKHIFFDLDHTLWDFDRNSAETLYEILPLFFKKNDSEFNSFIITFHQVNKELWALFNQGIISRETIRERRVLTTCNSLNWDISSQEEINLTELYLQSCPEKSHLLAGSIEILEYLKKKYTLHLITNGIPEIAQRKITASKIRHYFSSIVTSKESGFTKPDKAMYKFALTNANANAKECVMVGDDWEADINGAQNSGFKTIFFNPSLENLSHLKSDIYIQNLNEIRLHL